MAVIVPKALRGPGVVSVTRPATGALPGSVYIFSALMDAADMADATLVISQISLSLDSRVAYGPFDFGCGTKDHSGAFVPPTLNYACPETPPVNYTVTLTLPKQISIGMDVSLGSQTR